MNSTTLNLMIEEGKGYRTELFSGSGVRDVIEVVRFEMSELGNTDIPRYMQENCGILDLYHMDDPKEEDDEEAFSFMCQENISDIADEIGVYVQKRLNANSIEELNAIWLTTKENTKKIYGGIETWDIDEYIIPEDFVVLSDLGADGALFVFKR